MPKEKDAQRTDDRPKQDPIDHRIIVAGPDAHKNEGAGGNQAGASQKPAAAKPAKSQD